MRGLKLFVSHSSQDKETACAIVNLMRAALNLRPEEIRCTSVDGYRLSAGADTDEQLREEILTANAFIGIISPESLSSTYVLFELGGRWGAKRPLAPILAPGVDSGMLKGPLAGLHALSCDSELDLHQLVEDIAREIGIGRNSPSAYMNELKSVLVSRRVQSAEAGLNKEEASSSESEPELSPGHRNILRVLAQAEDSMNVRGFSDKLGWNKVKARHYLDELADRELIYIHSRSEEGANYRLTRKGRACSVKNGLV